jgi:ADP-ribose pyrophosphatase
MTGAETMAHEGEPGAERVLHSERVFAGRLLNLRVDRVALPNGRETTREVVEHPGAVAIVPLHDDGRVVLVRQYRHAVGRSLLEIPAGTLDQGEESAEAAAARELQEETGYRAARLTPLATFYPAPGFATERMTVFLATGLTDGDPGQMEDENITVEMVPLAELPALLARGEIADAKTLVGLLLARDAAAKR